MLFLPPLLTIPHQNTTYPSSPLSIPKSTGLYTRLVDGNIVFQRHKPTSGTVVRQTDFDLTTGMGAVSDTNLEYAILIRHKTM